MKKTLIRLTVPVILAALLMSLATSDALAKPPEPEHPRPETEEEIEALFAQLEASLGLSGATAAGQSSTLLGSGGSIAAGSLTASLEVNPWGCFGKTDNPHKSKHDPTTVNVEARTKCPSHAMPAMSVVTQLFKGSNCFFGVCYSWSPYGAPGVEHDDDVRVVETNSAGGPCVNGYYKGISYHWMRGLDGNTYTGVTINTQEVTNCR